MRLRVAIKVLRKVNGYGYGPKQPGYRFSTAIAALHRVVRAGLAPDVAMKRNQSLANHRTRL